MMAQIEEVCGSEGAPSLSKLKPEGYSAHLRVRRQWRLLESFPPPIPWSRRHWFETVRKLSTVRIAR